jgi:serine/threonine protein kinase
VHSKGVIHGDLHPGNITFSLRDEDFHLIDFGSAVVLGEPVKGVNYSFGSYRLTLPDYGEETVFCL